MFSRFFEKGNLPTHAGLAGSWFHAIRPKLKFHIHGTEIIFQQQGGSSAVESKKRQTITLLLQMA